MSAFTLPLSQKSLPPLLVVRFVLLYTRRFTTAGTAENFGFSLYS